MSSSNRWRGGVVHEVVLLERLHLAREVGRQLVELLAALLGDVLDELLAALVARARSASSTPPVDALALHVDDLVELLGDVVVDAAEVAALELLPAPLAQALLSISRRPMSCSSLRSWNPCCISRRSAALRSPW